MGKLSLGFDVNGAFAPKVVALTDGATVALDASAGNVFTLDALGDRTIAVPTNPTDGQQIVIRQYADGANRILTLTTTSGGFRFGSDITGLSTTASSTTDYITCVYNAADNFWDVIGYVQGYQTAPALAFDAFSSATGGSGLSSLSWSHTCSGSYRILIVGVFIDGGTPSEVISGVTYNPAAMTQLSKQQRAAPNNTAWSYLYYLIAPAMGTHTVEVTVTGMAYINLATGASYVGAAQSGQPDAHAENSQSSVSSISVTNTTVANNCYVVAYGYGDNGGTTAGTGMAATRGTSGSAIFGDSDAPVTSADAYVMEITGTSGNFAIQAASIVPAT